MKIKGSKLIEAVKAECTKDIEKLIIEGQDIEQTDDYGWTPLNWAAGKGDFKVVQKLLDLGANIANTGRDKRTAYKIALAAAHVECAEIFLNAEQRAGLKNEKKTQPYCKAYPVVAFRIFPNWIEEQADIEKDTVVFLHHDLTVTTSIWHGKKIVFAQLSPEWERFCKEDLAFSVPAELNEAAAFAARKTTNSSQQQS